MVGRRNRGLAKANRGTTPAEGPCPPEPLPPWPEAVVTSGALVMIRRSIANVRRRAAAATRALEARLTQDVRVWFRAESRAESIGTIGFLRTHGVVAGRVDGMNDATEAVGAERS